MAGYLRRSFVALALAASLSGCATTPSLHEEMVRLSPQPQGPRLAWEVVNRHRLLATDEQQKAFERDLAAYIEAYRHWYRREETIGRYANILDADLLPDPGDAAPVNYHVNYDPGTNSYRCHETGAPTCGGGADWIEDPARKVILRFGSAQESCDWTIDGAAEAGACERPLDVRVGVTRHVEVVRRSDGSRDIADVNVRDIKIVALGDSFSAGEGNPHVQWRYGRHPAYWLDARCHRSLMSGPALTAAYLARNNPQVSITLLHYGCSGASVADGVVTPWAQLETSADVRRRYAAFGIEGEQFDDARVATAQPSIHDVPRAQIEQALRDLTVDGVLQQPDLVLISVGGNDIGFAPIVEALAAPFRTEIDLKADIGAGGLEQVRDLRPYATFDQESWVQASRNAPCLGMDPVPCMERRVADRILGGGAPERATLERQYAVLAEALQPLVGGDSGRVFMTHYPTFVMREPDDVHPDAAGPEDAIGCEDMTGDGRPGFMPGILGDLRSAGMVRENSEAAETAFLKPLNAEIDRAAKTAGWNVVRGHVEVAKPHGYCSLNRYYNTLADSYWNQGRRYATGRPLGNLVILRPDNSFGLPVGTRVTWSADRQCFQSWPSAPAAPCLRPPHTLPVLQLDREIDPDENPSEAIAEPNTWGTTGPVHPNLFGHCNYAAAIVSEVVASRPDLALSAGPAPGGQFATRPAKRVCNPEIWGYHHPADRSDPPT